MRRIRNETHGRLVGAVYAAPQLPRPGIEDGPIIRVNREGRLIGASKGEPTPPR